jgi:hypothetical protein
MKGLQNSGRLEGIILYYIVDHIYACFDKNLDERESVRQAVVMVAFHRKTHNSEQFETVVSGS